MDSGGHFRRMKGWDYSRGASFFIMVALEERRPLFGHVDASDSMRHSPFGRVVQEALEAMPRLHPEIAKGNDETEFGRGACLDLNAEIAEIATAGEGIALHWREDGPHILARHSPAIVASRKEAAP